MILVCGEALVDVFAGADTPSGLAVHAQVGGSPFNVAVGLARLAQPVAFFGALSRGLLGERLMRALIAEGVDTRHIARSDAPTTISLVGLDAQGVPSYAFYGAHGADRQLTMQSPPLPPPLPLAGVGVLQLGSYTTVVEPSASVLRALVERERGHAMIAYDPNVRLNVEPDLQRWCEQLHWMLPRTHLLKASEEDLKLLLPDTPVEAFAAKALAQGVKLVVVTRGEQGAQAWSSAATAAVQGVEVDVIDTVAAGDSFQAALLTWLAEHGLLSSAALQTLSPTELRGALHFATQAAAITCSRRGAELPRRRELP